MLICKPFHSFDDKPSESAMRQAINGPNHALGDILVFRLVVAEPADDQHQRRCGVEHGAAASDDFAHVLVQHVGTPHHVVLGVAERQLEAADAVAVRAREQIGQKQFSALA